MLFNSFLFIFLFLPICLVAYYSMSKFGARAQILVIALASLVFYCGWDLRYLPLLIGSVTLNFIIGRAILKCLLHPVLAKGILIFGITINLLFLGYYKYVDFFIANMNEVGFDIHSLNIILPLGISFFTFTQTAFLIDAYSGKTDEPDFIQYLSFVAYFPHLIAGPILHHHETIPQFKRGATLQASWLAPGIAMFSIGLFKKVIIADTFGSIASPIFDVFSAGRTDLTFMDAWVGALSYTFQLYFDFSAYCDMAVGVSLMLGIYIPLNFNSPYKATNIIDFWRRWHMTLSRYLRDYLYIALGGNRRGNYRRYQNLMITMLIGGLWHGAGWTFVIWGGLHGFYLVVNHLWKKVFSVGRQTLVGGWLGRLLTFLCVVVAWVFFRADSVHSAMSVLRTMISVPQSLSPVVAGYVNNLLIPQAALDAGLPITANFAVSVVLLAGLIIVWLCRNSQELVFKTSPWDCPLENAPVPVDWTARWRLVILSSVAFLVGVAAMIAAPPGEFLYFNF